MRVDLVISTLVGNLITRTSLGKGQLRLIVRAGLLTISIAVVNRLGDRLNTRKRRLLVTKVDCEGQRAGSELSEDGPQV